MWSAPPNRYEIDQYAMNGLLRQTLRRTAPWFEAWEKPVAGWQDEVRPNTRLLGVTEDMDGRLWTLVQVPAADWKAARKPPADPRRETNRPGPTPGEMNKYLETVIEVIDPKTGQLFATKRLPGLISGFFHGNLVIGMHEDEEGILYTDVWQLKFVHVP